MSDIEKERVSTKLEYVDQQIKRTGSESNDNVETVRRVTQQMKLTLKKMNNLQDQVEKLSTHFNKFDRDMKLQ